MEPHNEILQQLYEIKSDLREHMRRTELLEEQNQLILARLTPIEQHIERWAGAGKAIAILGSTAALLGGLWKAFEMLGR